MYRGYRDVCRTSIITWMLFFVLVMISGIVQAAPSDWAEGSKGKDDGATRDYYNRGASLKWENHMGDWRDADNVPQGNKAYSITTLIDNDASKYVKWDVTALVTEWVNGLYQSQGIFLRVVSGKGTHRFRSREYSEAAHRPLLIVTTEHGSVDFSPEADTYLVPSTFRSLGHADLLAVSVSQNVLLRFNLKDIAPGTKIKSATLRLYSFAPQYGRANVGVFRYAQGDDVSTRLRFGLAKNYKNDRHIIQDPDVIFFANFESSEWRKKWSKVQGNLDTVDSDPDRKFEPFHGKALRIKFVQGQSTAMNTSYYFKKETGQEPEEVYFRYYLRFGDDWNQTLQGGKMPGFSGDYRVAGWGGRRVNGVNGWSARGSFSLTLQDRNPLAGTTPIGSYTYHADMEGYYGDVWVWNKGYNGYLRNNEWHSIEQYVKLNTPGTPKGKNDGIIRAWIDGKLAFEKTDIRFRNVDRLKIERLWMNFYHGGRKPSPYDQHVYIDNVVIAKKYIGPMVGTPVQ